MHPPRSDDGRGGGWYSRWSSSVRRRGRYVPDRAAAGRADGTRLDRAHRGARVGRAAAGPWRHRCRRQQRRRGGQCRTPGTLLLFAQTQRVTDESLLQRLADSPADLLLVEPTSHARSALAPDIRNGGASVLDAEPDCALREANQAGSVDLRRPTPFTLSVIERSAVATAECWSAMVPANAR